MEGEACIYINEKRNKVSIEECTIYKVHRHLREVNPKAYEPEILAIGPYHRHKDDLKMMEDHKFRCFNSLLQRIGKNVEKFVLTIDPLESRARKCYAEHISLKSAEFIQMLILDGCFIIEFVQYWGQGNNDPIFDLPWIFNSVVRDLILFENQIPFFVLYELSQVVFEVPNEHYKFMTNLLKVIFYCTHPLKQKSSQDVLSNGQDVIKHLLDLIYRPTPSQDVIKHLLDLMYRTWCPDLVYPPSNSTEKRSAELKFIESATRLEEANVKFQRNENVNLFEVEFKYGTILMPPLIIEDRTESLFRNLIAYEQYLNKSINYIRDYAVFLDRLVGSSKDIGILRRNGIIVNWLGDDEVVAKMVKKLTDSMKYSDDRFIYSAIFHEVNEHCRKPWNWGMAKLRRKYLNSAATVLLVLSLIQTVFAIFQEVGTFVRV